jgi:MinD superfamily P-loop ATPase
MYILCVRHEQINDPIPFGKKMTTTIAMAGKGGTGKTTVSALLIKYLVERAMTPVLAVDADANTNLNEVLGPRCTTDNRCNPQGNQE